MPDPSARDLSALVDQLDALFTGHDETVVVSACLTIVVNVLARAAHEGELDGPALALLRLLVEQSVPCDSPVTH